MLATDREFFTTDQEFFKPPEAARLCTVGHDTVLAWIHSGELRAVDLSEKRGKRPRWRIARTDLLAFLASRSATPPPKPRRRRRKPDRAAVTEYY